LHKHVPHYLVIAKYVKKNIKNSLATIKDVGIFLRKIMKKCLDFLFVA
jgi:hypothetical protein